MGRVGYYRSAREKCMKNVGVNFDAGAKYFGKNLHPTVFSSDLIFYSNILLISFVKRFNIFKYQQHFV